MAPVVAVKKLFDDASLRRGHGELRRDRGRPDGTRLAREGVTWTVSRIDRTWQWYRADGVWSYEATRTARRVADGPAEHRRGRAARLGIPADWGTYRLDVAMGGAQTSLTYSVGYAGELPPTRRMCWRLPSTRPTMPPARP